MPITVERPLTIFAPPAPTRPRVEGLDGLRGLAVLAVVLLHTGLLSWGWTGVDVFFALSGFLITGILLDAKAGGGAGWATYGRPFYIRRALRILPLALATIGLVFVVWPRIGLAPPTPAREQLWYWLFASNWYPWARSEAAWALSHLWSLSVEEQFYLVWPWVVLACSRRRLATVAAGLLVLSPTVRLLLALLPLPPQIGHTYETLTLARLDGLAAGALVAVLARDGRLSDRWIRWCVVGAVAFFVAALQLPESASYVLRYSAIGIAAGAAVAWLVSNDAPALLRWAPLRWLGTVSYGVYVMHPFLIHTIETHRGTAPGVRLFVLTAISTLTLAALTWYAAERPILRLNRFWPMPRAVGAQIMLARH